MHIQSESEGAIEGNHNLLRTLLPRSACSTDNDYYNTVPNSKFTPNCEVGKLFRMFCSIC